MKEVGTVSNAMEVKPFNHSVLENFEWEYCLHPNEVASTFVVCLPSPCLQACQYESLCHQLTLRRKARADATLLQQHNPPSYQTAFTLRRMSIQQLDRAKFPARRVTMSDHSSRTSLCPSNLPTIPCSIYLRKLAILIAATSSKQVPDTWTDTSCRFVISLCCTSISRRSKTPQATNGKLRDSCHLVRLVRPPVSDLYSLQKHHLLMNPVSCPNILYSLLDSRTIWKTVLIRSHPSYYFAFAFS